MDRVPDAIPARPSRIGIFGGSFDPPHRGHLSVATDVAEALGLDQVLWIPVAVPPHKPGAELAPADARLAMLRAVTADDDRFVVSTLELDRPGPSFTVDTVRALRAGFPQAELYLILGVDQFREFASWHRPDEIARHVTLVVLDREGESGEAASPNALGPDDVVFLSVRRVDVSGTEVRARASAGLDISGSVPESVRQIILDRRLYRA